MSRDIKGLGDLIAKATKATGVDKLAEKIANSLDYEDCGCDKRKDYLNAKVPFRPPKNK